MKKLSQGEEAFALHCQADKLYPLREFVFHPERKWRFDFAFTAEKLAVEIEGIGGGISRHATIGGFTKDCEKYNAAVLLGWRVLRYTTNQVLSGEAINNVREALSLPEEL